MANILLSGPAGSNKSGRARDILKSATEPMIQADFQSIVTALLGLVRDADTGLYPTRPTWILPLTEYVRQAVITGAASRGIAIVATNSDGAPPRRQTLLARLREHGAEAREQVVDPGRDEIVERLADEATGELSPECNGAVDRWYSRLNRG